MRKEVSWDFLGVLGANLQEFLVDIRDVFNSANVSTNILRWLASDGRENFREAVFSLVQKYNKWISDLIVPLETKRVLGTENLSQFSAEIFLVEDMGPVRFYLKPGFRKFFGKKVEPPSPALWVEQNLLKHPCFDVDIINRRGPVENLIVPLWVVYNLILLQSGGEPGFLSVDPNEPNIFYCLDDRDVPRGLVAKFIANTWDLDASHLEDQGGRGGGEWGPLSRVFSLYSYK